MNPRFAKELRPLLVPWCVAAVAAAGHLAGLANPVFARGEFGSFLVGLASVAFIAGVLALSALPIGFELHDRTLILLLSQPADRTRLWRDKLNAATISVLALAIVHASLSATAGRLSLSVILVGGALAVAAICSVGYYTLATRSIIAGIASAVGTPLAIALGVHLVTYYALGIEIELAEESAVALVFWAATVYSAFFLWLSRRQFAALELKDGPVSRAAEIPEALVPRKLTESFRCQPTGVVANLIRKEIHLQKPVFLVSAVFVMGWLLTLALMVARPTWHDDLVSVLHALTGTQIVLMVILAGCVSLGDDKAFGTTAWHLTLPVSARRQWLIKLLVAAATAVAMAVLLPTLLGALTLFKARVGLLALHPENALGFVMPCVVVFVMSFWSASLVANTIRAALTMILTSVALATVALFGTWSAEKLGGLQTALLPSLIARYQWSPYALDGAIPIIPIGLCLIVTAMLIALTQSFWQFRRVQSQSATSFRYTAILALVAFAIAFWLRDLSVSMHNQRYYFMPVLEEVTAALRAVMLQDSELLEGQVRQLTLQDLNNSQRPSDRAKLWVRNSAINVHWNESKSKHFAKERMYFGEIHLPNGVTVPLSWTVPDVSSAPAGKK
jgi:hypothetical protein